MAVDIKNVRITTINMTPLHVMDVSVRGALDRPLKAAVDTMGGNYDDDCGHLTWLMEHPLQPGDLVRVHLNQSDATGDAGKTFEVLFPDELPSTQPDFSISDTLPTGPGTHPRCNLLHRSLADPHGGIDAFASDDPRR